jgi:hypothetical protein
MAYETGTASSLSNLLGKISTFAQANGWTEDELDTVNGNFAFHKNDIYISMRWNVADPEVLAIYQALDYDAGEEPGDHTDDSGNGYNTNTSHSNTNLDNERCIDDIGDGPFSSYYFFEDDNYLHIVVEISSNVFRHMAFGEIDKYSDWTGGEYCCSQNQFAAGPTDYRNTVLFDARYGYTSGDFARRAATIHVEDLPNQDANGKWGQIWGINALASVPTDSAGEDKINIQGGMRGGPIARHFANIPSSASTGMVTMVQIGAWYIDTVTDYVYLLGYMPDIRFLNIRNFAPKQEVTIGSDTWVIFPTSQRTESAGTDSTYYSGIAYKKVTT